MIRGLVCLVVFAAALPAQVEQLTTTGDGSVLYFRTGFRLQSEKDLGSQGKVYQWRDGVITRLAAAQDIGFAFSPPNVYAPFVSSDGKIFGWQTAAGCILCQLIVPPFYGSQISGITLPNGLPRGNLHMSANGRYFTGDTFPFSGLLKYLDALTGAMTDLPFRIAYISPVRDVANDGTVLLALHDPTVDVPDRLALWKPGESPRTIYSDKRAVGVTLSAEGGRITMETIDADGARALVVLDTSSGERNRVASMPTRVYSTFTDTYAKPAWDVSGTVLVYRAFDEAGQPSSIAVWDAATRESRTLLRHDEGFSSAVVSGNGRIVWAVTGANRLVRADLIDGTKTEILPPLGAVTRSADGAGIPGSALLIRGVGFKPDQTAFEDDSSVPVVGAEDQGLWIQIPWEFQAGTQSRHKLLLRSAGSPFESVITIDVAPDVQPRIATTTEQVSGSALAKAVHQDYDALVTAENPARPGETIHVYLTGLGPLDRPVPTGAPGPYDPQSRPLVAPQCRLANTPLEMPFVSYAAGLIGVYEADLTMPDELFNASPSLTCSHPSANGVFQTFALLATTSAR